MPKISILLPNLNTRPFLEERMRSILAQTLSDWELIIADSFSTDGSWEYLKEFADRDPRIRAWQVPPGLYQSWNFCLQQVRGEYVYIATSDDSMTDDCLEKMLDALQKFPQCSLCHSALGFIDESGREIEPDASYSSFFIDYPEDQLHLRMAPYDGLRALAGDTVYPSITQILFRSSLLKQVGNFPCNFGSMGDFQWDMKAGLFANVVYLPEKLSFWRIRSGQATLSDAEFRRRNLYFTRFETHLSMVEEVAKEIQNKIPLPCSWHAGLKPMRFRRWLMLLTGNGSCPHRFRKLFGYLLKYPEDIVLYPLLFLYKRLVGIPDLSIWRTRRFLRRFSGLIQLQDCDNQ